MSVVELREGKTMEKTAKLEGKEVKLVALANCLDTGKTIEGVYQHIPRSGYFGLVLANGDIARLARDEWELVK